MKPECLSEQLLFNTVRLTTADESCGTGFFFRFVVEERQYLTIVTNKHVVNDNQEEEATFFVHLAEDDGTTKYSSKVTYKPHWYFHPRHDLCFCFAGPLSRAVKQATGKEVFCIANDMSILATDEKLNNLRALEEVTMVGYPIALWDEANNLPIFRKGYTASHPALDFNEPGVGLVDMACFPGSSGSPVFVLNEGAYQDKRGTLYAAQSRLILLGVLYAGPMYTAKGTLEVVDVPTAMTVAPKTDVMVNLGYYIRAQELLEFQKVIESLVARGLA